MIELNLECGFSFKAGNDSDNIIVSPSIEPLNTKICLLKVATSHTQIELFRVAIILKGSIQYAD